MITYTKDVLLKANIGDWIYGTPTIYPPLEEKVKIGKFCSIADGVFFSFAANHSLSSITTYPFDGLQSEGWPCVSTIDCEAYKPIIIENDVWIGRQAIIVQGSTISNGCIIGAFSVVRGYIPPYSVVIGNPAQIIKKRFSDHHINLLLEIQWWNWSIDEIKKNLQIIFNNDVFKLYEIYVNSIK